MPVKNPHGEEQGDQTKTWFHLTQRAVLRNLAKFPHKQLIVNMIEYYWDEIFHIHAKKCTPEILVMRMFPTRKVY